MEEKIRKERIDIVLAEYKALRDEIILKLRAVYLIYSIYFSSVLLIYTYIISNRLYILFLILPLVTLALFPRLHYDQKMIRMLGHYIHKQIVDRKISFLTQGNSDNPYQISWLGWEDFHGSNMPFPYYRISFIILFVVVSICPAMLHSGASIYGYFRNLYILEIITPPSFYHYLSSHSALLTWIWIQVAALIVNTVVGTYIWLAIVRDT